MLRLQFVPYSEISSLSSDKRIKRLVRIAKEDNIILLEGRLTKKEEADLIKQTMLEIDSKFKGIEISVVYPNKKPKDVIEKVKTDFMNLVLGNRAGFTIIGPATIVKEIKRDPDKILLLTRDKTKKRKKGR